MVDTLTGHKNSDVVTARNLAEVYEKSTPILSNETLEKEPEEDEMIYQSGGALALLTAGLCLCTFVVSPNHFVSFNVLLLTSC